MRQSKWIALTSCALMLTVAPFGLAQTPPRAPEYDAKVIVTSDGTTYTGSMTFQVDSKGAVTGTMALTAPATVNGTLSGTVEAGEWAVQIAYAMPDRGCEGTATGTAKVPADQKTIDGSLHIGGACTQDPLEATFTMTKK